MMEQLSGRITLHSGDCLDILPTLAECSIDSCVTDPPYGLSFMGRDWDHGVPGAPFWREVYRVLKPGAHLVAFGGSRTYHRMACAIEDAGFEIRDSLMWIYGTGFPKSHDVSKGIDKAAGAASIPVGVKSYAGGHVQRSSAEKLAPPIGTFARSQDDRIVYASATDAAREWEGWGTALKPAFEPIVLARKPLSEKTVAANVLRWRTGAINITATRVLPDTTDKFLSRAMQTASHVASELGDSMFCKDLSPNAALFASKLGKLLSAVDTSALFAEHEVSSERIGQSLQDYREYCPICLHFYGGLALVPLASDQVSARLSQYVRTHTRQPKHADGQAAEQLDSLRYECMTHLANLDSAFRSGREIGSGHAELRRAFSEYLKSCLRCTETLSPSQLSFDRADRVARSLVQPIEKTAWAVDRKDWGSPLSGLVFNIIVGPYIITNTMSILARCLREKSRWPANVCHDGSAEVVESFPETAPAKAADRGEYSDIRGDNFNRADGKRLAGSNSVRGHSDDGGSAARFFYSAKASKADRAGSKHPTVKPISLKEWLAVLITPPGGTILDPFAGSGTTGAAARNKGFRAVLIEREVEYQQDIRNRFADCRDLLEAAE